MTAIVRLACVFAVVMSMGAASVKSVAAQTAGTPRLVDQRFIEIPDSCIIAISPDGNAIAASAFDRSRLCIYEVATLAERVCADLAPLDAGLRLEDVVWSPDSSKLVLAEDSFKVLIDGDLWLMDAISGALTNLTDDGVSGSVPIFDQDVDFNELFLDVAPTWRPDGSAITFSRTIWRQGESVGNQIATVPVAGGEPEVLTTVTPDTPGVVYLGMRWTADGSLLYYAVNHPDSDHEMNGIWRIGADGQDATKLAGVDLELGPPVLDAISPDGETVLIDYRLGGRVNIFWANLYALVDVPTGTITPVDVDSLEAPDDTGVWPATLSSDGAFVLYASHFTSPDLQIVMEAVDGGEETILVPEGLLNLTVNSPAVPLSWSTTGTLLMGGDQSSNATLLTIEGGTDLEPVEPGGLATPVGPGVRQEWPTPVSGASGFEPGATVIVNADGVPLRSAPDDNSQIAAVLAFGTELVVVGSTDDNSGELWVAVTDLESGAIGYVRAEFLDPAAP